MRPKLHVFPGERYGMWEVLTEPRYLPGKTKRTALARCSCGTQKEIQLSDLVKGKTTKCNKCSQGTHGKSKTPEYRVWLQIIHRCNTPTHVAYPYYGGRGVTVCARWDPSKGGSFENFFNDVGERPGLDYQLDKEAYDLNNKEYGPNTCKWVPTLENCNRRNNTVFISYKGEVRSAADWARKLGINRTTLKERLRAGWSIENIMESPHNCNIRYLEYKGKKQSIKDWAMDTGIPYTALQKRLSKGWDVGRALETPLRGTRLES